MAAEPLGLGGRGDIRYRLFEMVPPVPVNLYQARNMYREIERLESIVIALEAGRREANALIRDLVMANIANLGRPADRFVTCYTYSGGEIPDHWRRAIEHMETADE
jgi:hypothetical protein